jgi:Tfp pilus assembly protein PilO
MKASINNIIIFVICAIVCLLLIFFGINPALSEVKNLHDAVKQQKVESATLDQQILAFKIAKSDLSKASLKDEIDTAIPTQETLVDAVIDLEAAADRVNSPHTLQIKDPSLNKTATAPSSLLKDGAGIQEIPYSLTWTSDYQGMLSFVAYLEHLPHFTEISRINLSAQTTASGDNALAHTGGILGSIDGVFFIRTQK